MVPEKLMRANPRKYIYYAKVIGKKGETFTCTWIWTQ
jgi:hypothetical protein